MLKHTAEKNIQEQLKVCIYLNKSNLKEAKAIKPFISQNVKQFLITGLDSIHI